METAQIKSLKFSGHESFHCRHFWLKKGFDYINNGESFSDKSGIDLGVGKNMVASIRFWMKAFDMLNDEGDLTELSKKLFGEGGWDPYLEDEATLWLLHYKLSAKKYASVYHLIFTELRKVKTEFTSNHFVSLVNELDSKQSDGIVGKDFTVFTRTYFAKPSKDKEESFSGLLTELNLLHEVGDDSEKNRMFHIYNENQNAIPWQLVLFCILDNENYGSSIGLNALFNDDKGVGTIFAFNKEGLEGKLDEMSNELSGVTYKNDAGVKELQLNKSINGMKILADYYEK